MTGTTQSARVCGNCLMLIRRTEGYAKRGECAYWGVAVNKNKILQVDGKDCDSFAPKGENDAETKVD